MKFPKPILEVTLSCRRELLLSMFSSILLTSGIVGGLALVTVQISRLLEINEPAQPLMVSQAESEDQPEKPTEDTVAYEPSPAVSAAPSALVPPTIAPMPVAETVPVPEVDEQPKMDDLAWSEESFEPWMEEKKPEVKKKPTPRPVLARKPAPRKKSPKASTTPKRTTVKPVSARVVSRSSPSYPSKARRTGLEGRVIVTVTISTSGHVSSARISKSSSHSSLDSAALRAAKKYRFTPARNSRGQAVATQISIPFSFKLT